MLVNYFKIAWRNLIKNKFYSALNISGLAIGLAVGIMILLWVQDEFAYDGFHKNADDIYKINSHFGTGADAQVWEDSPAPLAVMFRHSVPEVSDVVRINPRWDQLLFTYGDKKMMETSSAYVDPSFFSMFDFGLIKGKTQKPFSDIYSVVLTRSVAKKYFDDQDPIGKIMSSGKDNYIVSGIINDFSDNSGIQYDMLFPMSLYAKKFTEWGGNGDWKTIDEDLGNYQYFTYVQLKKNASPSVVSKKITKLFRDKKGAEAKDDFFALQPLKTVHLVTADGNKSALQTVRIFLIVAILILCIACINYVNLSTARSILRSKEVSIRKIIGAGRSQLFIQFISESVLVFLFSTMLAFLLIYLLLPLYNDISGKNLLFSLSIQSVWLIVGCSIAGTMILSAVYPALLLSSFKPIQALKGKLISGIGNASFRKILVVTQFAISIGLIISTIVIRYQLAYIKDRDLGFNKEHVFSFGLTQEMNKHVTAVKTELAKQPGVLGVASSNNSMVGINATTGDTDWEGKEKGREFMVHPNGIDENLIPLLKIQMLEGSNFTGAKADSAYFILNETAVKLAGIRDPVGKSFTLWQTKGMIKGVVKDFNYASLKYAVEPAVFYFSAQSWRMYIKTTEKNASKAIASAQKVWKQYTADYPFDYTFLDDDFNRMYKSEQRTGTLFNIFAAVGIFISCLGLFGLATYTAEVKTKEIGIRKVLGATITDLTTLLAKDFILLVFTAFIIASPIAWIAMHEWLQNYAYRVNVSWWIFFVTGLIAVIIALLAVSFQAIKAAIANPVKSLRTE
ncbi:MAG: ABC transporter permease [Chitinophagaceae bacterium]